MTLQDVKDEIKKNSNPQNAQNLSRFFKTAKGEYGEGDVFVGIKIPVLRQISQKFKDISLSDNLLLLKSEIHEERMLALFILIKKYSKANEEQKSEIFQIYLTNRQYINNWDLVDLSAYKIVGDYLFEKDKSILYQLAVSNGLWDKRISMISTYLFIKNDKFEDTFKLAEILLNDKHDLIQKAVGWMLREIGKRDIVAEKDFLKNRYKNMPRTMLRYAIEKFEETERQKYLKGLI